MGIFIGNSQMNKGELITQVMKDTGLAKKDSTKVVDSFFEAIMKSLKKGKEATFIGFGTFSIINRKAREGRNPKTQEVIKIPAAKVPKFKPGKNLKDAVN